MKKFFGLSFVPAFPDLGLLLFRVALAWVVLRYHGWGKLAGWQDEPMHLPNLFSLAGFRKEFHTFPDYIHISSELSYLLVTWFETFGSMMVIVGLFTRLNALGMFITLTVAWIFHHHMHLSGPNSGEVAFTYAFAYLLLFLSGAGKYSVDRRLGL
ncbi:MAG TPA: DoxX family protein [Candidatus Didemnitutus sp.]|nr:DoxX family protein [Candidatus Didemnitutus sp.]